MVQKYTYIRTKCSNIQNMICIKTTQSLYIYKTSSEGHNLARFKIPAFKDRCLPVCVLYLKGGVRELTRLVEAKPTRATPHLSAHAMEHHTFSKNMHVPTQMFTCHG